MKVQSEPLPTSKPFTLVAQAFEKEYEAITLDRRSPKWVQGHKDRTLSDVSTIASITSREWAAVNLKSGWNY